MKATLEERFRKKLLKAGKKNRVCRMAVLPVMAVGMFFFHAAKYMAANGKRLAILPMTLLLFVFYSSFSFPLFVSGARGDNGLSVISDEAQAIELATEAQINLEDMELLDEPGYDESGYEGEFPIETAEAAPDSEAEDDIPETGGIDISQEFSRDDWRLLLVNKQHSIPEDYEFTLGAVNTVKGTMYCDERIIEDWLAMKQAAKEDGVTLVICSPYRDTDRQEVLFNKITAYMGRGMSYIEAFQLSGQAVTVPGASEHQVGLALDIVTPSFQNLVEEFEETDAGVWLAENSYQYGFILRYPKGKEYITCIQYEPWHFRYVGREAAAVIWELGITLEEFWEEL